MKITEKAYAKINLALCVRGASNGFHNLDSLVTTVDLYDTVTVKKRKDDKITVTAQGLPDYVYNHVPEKDNVYKVAVKFMQKFNVGGADVIVKKRIPISSGMGGSSTDAAAVLRALKKAYKIDDSVEDIANESGSDTAYLLQGGFARLNGRGEIITSLNIKEQVNFVVIFFKNGVNTAECFKAFDKCGKIDENGSISALIDSFVARNPDYSLCKNDLSEAAISLNPDIKRGMDALKKLSPKACFMTGSGSAVCGIFETEELCRWAVDKLVYDDFNATFVKSIQPKENKFFG